MNKTQSKCICSVLRFKKFSRKHYAAFISMHKEVTIGTLKRATIDAQMKKSHTFIQTLNMFEQSICALFENEKECADNGNILNILAMNLILLQTSNNVTNCYPAGKAFYCFTSTNTS